MAVCKLSGGVAKKTQKIAVIAMSEVNVIAKRKEDNCQTNVEPNVSLAMAVLPV